MEVEARQHFHYKEQGPEHPDIEDDNINLIEHGSLLGSAENNVTEPNDTADQYHMPQRKSGHRADDDPQSLCFEGSHRPADRNIYSRDQNGQFLAVQLGCNFSCGRNTHTTRPAINGYRA